MAIHYCFITSGSWSGNAGLVRPRELGGALAELGVKVSYVVDDIPENRRDLLGVHNSARVEYVLNPHSPSNILSRRKLVSKLEPDFVHLSIHSSKGFLALIGLTRLKVIGDWDEWPVRHINWARRAVNSLRDAWLRRRSFLHVVTTHHLQKRFHERFDLNPLYLPYAQYLRQYPDAISPFTQPTFVYLGNLLPMWDHDIIFEAIASLAKEGIRPPVVVLGSGPELEKWRSWTAACGLDHVKLPGFIAGEALWQHLRHAHALLFPMRPTDYNMSRCSSKTFAYMQAGRPIITSPVGEIPYLLGDHADYVNPTPQGFADAIRKRALSPRAEDVHFDNNQHTWGVRAKTLLSAIREHQAAIVHGSC